MSSAHSLADDAPEAAPPPCADPAAPVSNRPRRLLSALVLEWVDCYRRWLFLGLLVVYLAGFSAQWRLEPDSALYLSIGRNLAEGLGYTFHGKSHRLAYPGLPVLFAGVYKMFGTGGVLPHLLVMLAIALATLLLTYRLVLLYADRPTAVIVTLGVGMSRVFYRYSFELLSDMPFLLGVMAFLVGYESFFHRRIGRTRWLDVFLLVGGIVVAVTMRPAMVALVMAVVVAMGWSLVRGRARWGQALVMITVIAVVVAFYLRDPRRSNPGAPSSGGGTGTVGAYEEPMLKTDWWRTTAKLIVTDHIPELLEPTIAKAAFGMPLGTGLNTVFGVTVLTLGIGLARRRPLWGLWVLMTMLIILLVPKPMDRYFLPVLPLLVLAWWQFLRWLNDALPPRWANAAFLVLFAAGAVPNGAKVIGFIYEQQYRPFRVNYKEGRYASANELARLIHDNTPAGIDVTSPQTAWVLVPPKFARILSFLSRRNCVEPDAGTAVDPARQPIFVVEPSDPTPRDVQEATEQGTTDQGAHRATVHQWLAGRRYYVAPQVLASAPNRDPRAKVKQWSLHRAAEVTKDEVGRVKDEAGMMKDER